MDSVESGQTEVVGVNLHQSAKSESSIAQTLDTGLAQEQILRLSKMKDQRDTETVERKLSNIREAANSGQNLLDPMIDAYLNEVTLGEVNSVLRDVFGTWISPSGV